MRAIKGISALAAALVISSCAAMPVEKKSDEEYRKEKLSFEEQGKRAQEVFEKILQMTMDTDRMQILPEIEREYEKIIDEYPDAPLAHESYLRLILISIEDYTPPMVEKAESLYREFVGKYPDSYLKRAVEDTLIRFYYDFGLWDRLIVLLTPYIKEYIKTGKLSGPYLLFLYSEAKMNLEDKAEAIKGFKSVIELFPDSTEAKLSRNRLNEIQNSKK